MKDYNNDITALLIAGGFQHFVGVYDGTKILLYKNGAPTSMNYSQGIPDSGTPLTVGSSGSNSYNLVGKMDEVRISNIARDACWIETEYSNQSNPAAFHSIGDEEETGVAVITWAITASSEPHGSIYPSGDVIVEDGHSQGFLLEAAEGYEVSRVRINNVWQDWSSEQYLFNSVRADASITVEFNAASDEEPTVTPPPGCSQNIARDYTAGFVPDDLDIVNASVDNKHVVLNTGNTALDPDHIVIPFRQQVSVCFLYEGAGDRTCDFGWMLFSEGINGTKHEIYYNIVDENDDGILELDIGQTTSRFGDRNGDGPENALDSCEVISTFDAGTELVFYLKSDQSIKVYRDIDYGDVGDRAYWYTKTAWNQDKYTSYFDDGNDTNDNDSCDRNWGDRPRQQPVRAELRPERPLLRFGSTGMSAIRQSWWVRPPTSPTPGFWAGRTRSAAATPTTTTWSLSSSARPAAR